MHEHEDLPSGAPAARAVSVIATVFNEAATIPALLDSLAAQTRPPDEVVVVDGGSTDGTVGAVRAWRAARPDGEALRLTLLERPGANISQGRNAAIAAAAGPILAATDAGVRLVPGWLADLVAPIERGEARWAAGFFTSAPEGAFETALGATTLPEVEDIDPTTFLPSSRSVAFLKADAAAIGGYPEWLDYCEDLVFDLRLKRIAGPPAFAPSAVARFRPRPTLARFARQYYLYARGDGKADLWRRRHAIRYLTYVVAGPSLVGLAMFDSALWWIVPAAGIVAMVAKPYRRLARQWQALTVGERVVAAWCVPVIRVTGDVAKMFGYPVGWAWRRRERPPDWRADGGSRRPQKVRARGSHGPDAP